MQAKIFAAFLLLASCAPKAASIQDNKASIAWRKDTTFAQLLEEAKAKNKPIMLDVYATWCEPCQAMDALVYNRQDVSDATAKFLAIKLDGEIGEGMEVHDKYKVKGFPTILFLRPDGSEISRIFGGMNAADFLAVVNKL